MNGCGGLSVIFSDIYLVKKENGIAVSSKPCNTFYQRFADDIYSIKKIGDNALFYRLNNYHPNIKLAIELNPRKFLDTKLTNINGFYKFNISWKSTKLPSPWTSKTPNP